MPPAESPNLPGLPFKKKNDHIVTQPQLASSMDTYHRPMKHLAQKSFPLPHRPKLPPKTTSSRILPHQSHFFLLPQPPTPADIQPPVPEGMGS